MEAAWGAIPEKQRAYLTGFLSRLGYHGGWWRRGAGDWGGRMDGSKGKGRGPSLPPGHSDINCPNYSIFTFSHPFPPASASPNTPRSTHSLPPEAVHIDEFQAFHLTEKGPDKFWGIQVRTPLHVVVPRTAPLWLVAGSVCVKDCRTM